MKLVSLYAMAWLTRMQRNQGNARCRSEPRPCLVRSPCLNSRLNNSHPSPGWSPGPHPGFGPDRGQGQSQGQLTRLKLVRDARAQDSPRTERGALYSLLATANLLLFFCFPLFVFFGWFRAVDYGDLCQLSKFRAHVKITYRNSKL